MRSPTLRAAAALLPLLALAPAAERPRFAPQEGARVRRTLEHSMQVALETMEMRVDGEELPEDLFEAPEVEMQQADTIVVVDTFGRVVDGRPLELVRRFETLEGSSSQRTVGPDGEADEQEVPRASELEQLEVRFTWDEDEERYAAAFTEEEGDEALLEELEEDLDLRGILPDRDMEEGESWDVPLEAIRRVLSPGGDLGLEDAEGEPDDEDFSRQMEEHLEAEARATWRGVREVDGRRVGAIALALEARTHADQELSDEQGGGQQRFEVEHGAEGELLWDLDAGRALELTLEGPLRVRIATTTSIETDEGSLDFAQTMVLAGTQRVAWRVEAVE